MDLGIVPASPSTLNLNSNLECLYPKPKPLLRSNASHNRNYACQKITLSLSLSLSRLAVGLVVDS